MSAVYDFNVHSSEFVLLCNPTLASIYLHKSSLPGGGFQVSSIAAPQSSTHVSFCATSKGSVHNILG